ncbi:ABC transporter I family member 10, chloroplastic [Apostasia shenzhenica]|uniref:ABC transporter I family member 10, chloroplastic n=1 Tax=Apostasia shenzhenica TaxID=1088818 RepID=A0A2H9ZR58_9ASPA|nr:ABC transporter I family member 10, chloroplastic [Apostasia shenzhenica]
MPAALLSAAAGVLPAMAARSGPHLMKKPSSLSYPCSLLPPSSFICSESRGFGTGGGPRLDSSCFSSSFAIEGRNLSFSVAGSHGVTVPILRDCSLRVPSRQLWMLLGPNGCGKSTLLKFFSDNQILAGLLSPTEGTVHVNRPKSFVFQNPDHQVVMPTVEADVAFGLGRFDLTLDEVRLRVSKALDAVGMLKYSRRPIQTLSGGQKQRVAIAGALAEASKVLLLDELTTFLDEYDQLGVINAVKKCVAGTEGVAALWVTHRLEELRHADGAIYMEDGRIIMHGDVVSIVDFFKQTQADYIDDIIF